MAFEFVSKIRIIGKIIDLVGVFFEVVKFFGRAFPEEGPGRDLSKFPFGVVLTKARGLGLSVAILGLQANAIGHDVAYKMQH